MPDVNRTRLNGKIAKYDMIRCFSQVLKLHILMEAALCLEEVKAQETDTMGDELLTIA